MSEYSPTEIPQVNAKVVEYDMQNGTHVVQQRFYNENGAQLRNADVRESMAPGVENLFAMLSPTELKESGTPDTAKELDARQELMDSIKNPQELKKFRETTREIDSDEIKINVKEITAKKLQQITGKSPSELDVNEAKNKFGHNIIKEISSFYGEVVRMSDDEFDAEIERIIADRDKKDSSTAGSVGYDPDLHGSYKDYLGLSPFERGVKKKENLNATAPVRIVDRRLVERTPQVDPKGLDGDSSNDSSNLPAGVIDSRLPGRTSDESDKEAGEIKTLDDGTKIIDKRKNSTETSANSSKSVSKRIRDRWSDIKLRGSILASGDFKGAFGDKEDAQLITKRRLIGAAAVAAGVWLAYQNNSKGWGIDINPFDGDGFDLNPFNSGPDGAAEIVSDGLDNELPADSEINFTTVQVNSGEGTSHIASNILNIDFETVEQWNEFNTATNPLFEGLEGVYQDAASGEWRISSPGSFELPQPIIEEMQSAAKKIKTRS